MNTHSLIAGIAAAIALSACADIPRGPALTYEQLLPNTHENPVWARNRLPGDAQEPPKPEPAPGPTAPR